MRTQAQIEASRRNGAKSSGPKTEDGKARSSQNAIKHGLSANKFVVLDGESGDDWETFHQSYIGKFQPRDLVEEHLVLDMAVNRWRLQRAWSLETAAIDEASIRQRELVEEEYDDWDETLIQSRAYVARRNGLHSIGQFESRLARNFDRALKQFNALRAKSPQTFSENEPKPSTNRGGVRQEKVQTPEVIITQLQDEIVSEITPDKVLRQPHTRARGRDNVFQMPQTEPAGIGKDSPVALGEKMLRSGPEGEDHG